MQPLEKLNGAGDEQFDYAVWDLLSPHGRSDRPVRRELRVLCNPGDRAIEGKPARCWATD